MATPKPPALVRSLGVTPLDLPLRTPFGISRGELGAARNVLVMAELEDGSVGYGEAAPFPAYNGETQECALAALGRAAAWVPGRDAWEWRTVARDFCEAEGTGCGSALCALESALLDAACRQGGLPLWDFFGGAGTVLETDMTVTTGSADEAAAAARSIRARGIRVIKVKVGGPGGTGLDIKRIASIADAAPGSPLVLDGNAGLSRSAASELAKGIRFLGLDTVLLEQWLDKDDLEGMRALGSETGWPVAADEAVVTAADVHRIAEARAAQIVNVKLMKAGVSQALEVVAAAREARLGLMIGGNVESILAMTMSACFAAGLGGFVHADLDTPMFLASNPFAGGFILDGSRISLGHITAGHGVTPLNQGETGLLL